MNPLINILFYLKYLLYIKRGCSILLINQKEEVMNTEKNKEIVEGIFNDKLNMLDYFADDGLWTINGIRAFHGKKQVTDELLIPFANQIASMGKWVITNMFAEGDYVAAEIIARDRVTKKGLPYNNTYCIVCQFDNGKIARLTEYCNTDLFRKTFPELNM
jgi:uncharacterized protein